MKINRNNATKTVIIVMVLTIFARIFGFIREILIANYYGTSKFTDAYIISNNIPTVVFEIIGQAIMTTFIPMYSKVKNSHGKDRADTFTLHLAIVLMIICTILTIIGEIFTEWIVLFFASGFKGETLDLTVNFSRILIPSLYAMTLLSLFTGYLQLYDNFIIPTLVTVIGNITIIISLIISNKLNNIYFFIWGSLIGLVLQVIFMLPSVLRLNLFENYEKNSIHDSYVFELVHLLIPVFIGSALNEINSIVDRNMVSGLDVGSVSVLNYAYKIVSLVITTIAIPIINYSYPHITQFSSKGELNKFKDSVRYLLNIVLAIILPISCYCIGFRQDIIKIFFERGNFNKSSSLYTSSALGFYAIGLASMAVQQFLIRVFYSMQNTKNPMINSFVCTGINIYLDYLLIKYMGTSGAAFATSIATIISSIILIWMLCKQDILRSKEVIRIIFNNLFSSCCLLVIVYIIRNYIVKKFVFGFSYLLFEVFLVFISGSVYVFIQKLLHNYEVVDEVFRVLRIRKGD